MIKNFAAILMLSQGVPMVLFGDEGRRTQWGNNNAYCQDNEISWFDWDRLEQNCEIHRFFKLMIAMRKRYSNLHRAYFFSGKTNERGLKDIEWHGCRLYSPGWDDPDSHVLAFTLGGFSGDPDIHVMLNMDWQDLDFDIPVLDGVQWRRVVDTSLPSPEDIAEAGEEVAVSGSAYRVNGRSVVVLVSLPSWELSYSPC